MMPVPTTLRFSAFRVQWADLVLPTLAAIPIASVIAFIDPSRGLPIILGTLALIAAFMSPLVGIYILVFSMLLGPELIVGGLGGGTTLGRGITLRFDDFLLVLVGFGWLSRLALSRGFGTLARTPLNRPILYYTAACALATFVGMLAGRVSPFGGFFFLLKYYEYFFLYFMTVNIVSERKQLRHLVRASMITFLLVGLYALSQIPSGVRVSAPFEGPEGEPNTLGGYLVFLMSIMVGLLLTSGAVPRRLPYMGLMGIGAIALQATLSRASFLAGGVVFAGVIEMVRRRSPALLAVLLMGLLAAPFVMPESVVNRMLYTFTQEEEEGQIKFGTLRVDTSTSERLRSYEQAMTFFRTSPVWGVGVTGGPFMDAMYPRVLMETGVIGLGAFAYLIYSLFRLGLNAYWSLHDPYYRGIALGFLMGLVGLLIHALGANTFIIVRIMEPFWLYAAVVAKSVMMIEPAAAGTGEEATAVRPTRAPRAGGGLMGTRPGGVGSRPL